MQFHISVILLVIATASASPGTEVEFYHVNVPDWTTVPISELDAMLDCIEYGKTCNPMREPYRAAYPAVLISKCDLCTTHQKKAAYAFYIRATKDLAGRLAEFRKTIDPEGKYFEPFLNVLKAAE